MRVLIAGATGAIGRPLVQRLLRRGHEVAALARSDARAAELTAAGVEAHVCDVFDAASVRAAVAAAAPEVLVHQLTAIPAHVDLRHYERDFAPTERLRREATPHLMAAAAAAGVRRVVCQSVSFMTVPEGPSVHDEDARIFTDNTTQLGPLVRATAAMEASVLGTPGVDGVVLRYGFFYGPGTAYGPGGGTAQEVAKRRFPIAGRGTGVASFVHVDDAAEATVLAVEGTPSGVFNVCDDAPEQLREWLPALAAAMGAPPPRAVPVLLARWLVGPHVVHFSTALRGNSNARFKQAFRWEPAHPSWRTGFPEVFAGS
ncbi:MAG: NAD(P)-dependent oxidoreductase [Solirubrobacterales bacterium]|nr:NAD(P)-dependent oxidoreductase [Solirubrobacterales bacterium]